MSIGIVFWMLMLALLAWGGYDVHRSRENGKRWKVNVHHTLTFLALLLLGLAQFPIRI